MKTVHFSKICYCISLQSCVLNGANVAGGVTSSWVHNVIITGCRKLKGTRFGWPLMG
jgi:hypothetical protein